MPFHIRYSIFHLRDPSLIYIYSTDPLYEQQHCQHNEQGALNPLHQEKPGVTISLSKIHPLLPLDMATILSQSLADWNIVRPKHLRCPVPPGKMKPIIGAVPCVCYQLSNKIEFKVSNIFLTYEDWIPDKTTFNHLEEVVKHLVMASFVENVNSSSSDPPFASLRKLKDYQRDGESLLAKLKAMIFTKRGNMHDEQKELRKRMTQALGEMESIMKQQAADETARKQDDAIQNTFDESELVTDGSSGDLISRSSSLDAAAAIATGNTTPGRRVSATQSMLDQSSKHAELQQANTTMMLEMKQFQMVSEGLLYLSILFRF